MDSKTFGAFIQSQRRSLGMTQADLAQKLHVTDKAVSRWERGVGFPEVTLMEPLAKALEISLLELMQSRKQEAETLSRAEAETVVAGALELVQEKRAVLYENLQWLGAYLAICSVAIFFIYVLSYYVMDRTVRSVGILLVNSCGCLGMDAVRTALGRKRDPDNPSLVRDWKFYLACVTMVLGGLLVILSFDIRDLYGTAACHASRLAAAIAETVSILYLIAREQTGK